MVEKVSSWSFSTQKAKTRNVCFSPFFSRVVRPKKYRYVPVPFGTVLKNEFSTQCYDGQVNVAMPAQQNRVCYSTRVV